MRSNTQQHAARGQPRALTYRVQVEQELDAILVQPLRDIGVGLEIDHDPSLAAGDALWKGQVDNAFDGNTFDVGAAEYGAVSRGAVLEPHHQRAFAPQPCARGGRGFHQWST